MKILDIPKDIVLFHLQKKNTKSHLPNFFAFWKRNAEEDVFIHLRNGGLGDIF